MSLTGSCTEDEPEQLFPKLFLVENMETAGNNHYCIVVPRLLLLLELCHNQLASKKTTVDATHYFQPKAG